MNLCLGGKVAIVTGAARGIGAAIASSFAAEGMKVILGDINPVVVETASHLLTCGYQAEGVVADVTNPNDVEILTRKAIDTFGRVDVLVNNAGFPKDSYLSHMSIKDWDLVVDVIMKGAFLCTKACMPHMIKRGFGRVINISSRAYLGNPGQANYSAAKAGLIGFTRATALESGKFNVTVNAIAPGFIRTEGIQELPNYQQVAERAIGAAAIPRVGEVEDIAATALFLASGQAGFITGEVVHVTGGRFG